MGSTASRKNKTAAGGAGADFDIGAGFDMMRAFWSGAGFPPVPAAAAAAAPVAHAAAPVAGAALPPTGPLALLAPGLSMVTPTLDVDELDKRIANLRAVEQWLQMHGSMLRATIQGLEVQRNTIATLRGFGAALGEASQATKPARGASTASDAPQSAPPAAQSARPTAAPPPDPLLWWNALQDQFMRLASTAAATAPDSKPDKPASKRRRP
jgi:hypothetical protein